MAALTGVIPLTDARSRRLAPRSGLPPGVIQPGMAGVAPDPNAPLEIGDARPYTPRTPAAPAGPLEIGDAVPYGSTFNTAGPAGRAQGNPLFTPRQPAPVQQPMPGGDPARAAWEQGRAAWLAGGGQDGAPQQASPQDVAAMQQFRAAHPASTANAAAGAGGGSPGGGFPLAGGYSTGYASMQPFGPGNDLRGTAILPTDSAATQRANAATQQAMGAYQGWQANPWQGVAAPGSYAAAGDTTGLRSSLTQAINALQSAPDRGQLASSNFNLLDQTAREASNRDLRVIGQDAAKFGRIGSGITTTNLGDLGERQALARSRAQEQMSLDAAGQTMADRLATAGAIGSGFGALSGADAQTAGINAALRGEARGERDSANAFNAADFARRGQLFGDLANYGQLQTSNDAARRDEFRGERGYMGGMETQAYNRGNDAIDRAYGFTNTNLGSALGILGAGQGYDPSGLIAGIGANRAGSAGAGAPDWVRLLLASRGG